MGYSHFIIDDDDDNDDMIPPPSPPSGNPPINGKINIVIPSPAMSNTNDDTANIDDLLINYNEKFKKSGKTLFRDALVQQTLSVLIGKNKPNALLVGAAGVGKTKIVEDIAYRLENNDSLIPQTLIGYTIYELPLSNIVAGSTLVGQVEQKIKAVIEFATNKDNKAILFIDEIHMLIGESQTYEKIAQILKPALARGDMRVIGATTLQESSNLADDPAFNRRFSRLIVDELTRSQTIEILKQAKQEFIAHYNNKIIIDDDILTETAIIADQYSVASSHRPDTALTLLDRALGDAIIHRKVLEEQAKSDPNLLMAIRSLPYIQLSKDMIKTTAIKLMTGHAKQESLNMDILKDELSIIRGQDNIIENIITILKNREKGLFTEEKTPLTLLFAGASGVGKTEMTKILARVITQTKPIILNMTEFNSPASVNRIIGAPAGYVGSDSKAELPFDCLESNPYQIILLDEFEKCDDSVKRLFMSVFDEGILKTNKGKTIDFSKSILIATTNAANDKIARKTIGFEQASERNTMQKTIDSLSDHFDVALLNRFDKILTFNKISKDVFMDILREKYKKEVERIKKTHRRANLPDEMPDDDVINITEHTYIPDFGARPVRKAVRAYIEQRI